MLLMNHSHPVHSTASVVVKSYPLLRMQLIMWGGGGGGDMEGDCLLHDLSVRCPSHFVKLWSHSRSKDSLLCGHLAVCSSGLTLVPKTLCYVAILLCVALVSLLLQILSVRCTSRSTNSDLAVAPLLRHPGLHLEPCGFNYDPVFSLYGSVSGSIDAGM